MDSHDGLVSLRELARATGISGGWLKQEADAGGIPSLRAGRRRLFSVEAVRRVLLQRAAGVVIDAATMDGASARERGS